MAETRLRIAVVDLDKAPDYPLNFVCMLPTQLDSRSRAPSSFMMVFGDKSLEVARKLLSEALEAEGDPNVKEELKRRLKLLEAKPSGDTACVSCGKLFQAEPRKGFKQKFCQACLEKKFAARK